MPQALVNPNDGRVWEVQAAQPSGIIPAPPLTWIECDETVTIKHTWNGAQFVAPPDPPGPPAQGELRADAVAQFQANRRLELRALALVTKDEVNILRRQIVGIVNVIVNPPSLANGAVSAAFNVAVDGGTPATKAAFGDVVILTAPYDVQGLFAYGWVQDESTGNVRGRIFNPGVGTTDLASGSWKVIVWRPESMTQRTAAQAKTAIENKINDEESD